jgi:hypothetical protein
MNGKNCSLQHDGLPSSEKVLAVKARRLLPSAVVVILIMTIMTDQVTAQNSSISGSKAAAVKYLSGSSSSTFQVLPLIPHHQQMERTRRERALQRLPEEQDLGFLLDDNNRDDHGGQDDITVRRRRNEIQQVGALYQGYGTHYVDLWCGSPPQRQTVIVDSGSAITAFPCSRCSNCGVPDYHIDNLFDEKSSSTYRPNECLASNNCVSNRSHCTRNQCTISMSYAEGSRWDAYEGIDRCYVAGPHEIPMMTQSDSTTVAGVDVLNPVHAADLAFDLVFGCQTLVTGLFKTQLADGIMGMSNRPETFWKQMFDAGKLGSDQSFSLCFSRQPTAQRKGTEAGALTMGGSDVRLHLTPMVFTPHASSGRDSFFSVKVRRVMLREGRCGESVQSILVNPNEGVHLLDVSAAVLNQGGVIVDSGTTDTFWTSGIASEFGRKFKQLAGREHTNKGMKLTDAELLALPTILFQLESDNPDVVNPDISDIYHTPGMAGALDPDHPSDIILAIPPSHYMEYDPSKGSYTSRFYPTERSGSVLGANAIMGHDVFFDVDTDRIGWAESSCDYTSFLRGNGYEFDIKGQLHQPEVIDSNGDASPLEPEELTETDCESLSSGAKCQAVEGCSWYWGECTKAAPSSSEDEGEADEVDGDDNDDDTDDDDTTEGSSSDVTPPKKSDSPGSSPSSISSDTAGSDDDESVWSAGSKFVDACSSPKCWLPVVLGVLLAIFIGCCLSYCCCRKRTASDSHKYSRAPVDPVEIELTHKNGHGTNGGSLRKNGGNHTGPESFRDEPEEQPSNGKIINKKNGGSRPSSLHGGPSYRDEPEFDGDFA